MSTWQAGRMYYYYGDPLICWRRFFEGNLELVEFAHPVAIGESLSTFTRTARALAPCVMPVVTETLGGVTNPSTCDHRDYGNLRANAGPHRGHMCCEACGSPLTERQRVEGDVRRRWSLRKVMCQGCGLCRTQDRSDLRPMIEELRALQEAERAA